MQGTTTAVTTDGLITPFTTRSAQEREIALSSALLQRERIEDHPNILKDESALQYERIIVDPKVLNGEPHVRGTRVPVSAIVDGWVEGLTYEELMEHYPRLTRDDIQAALGYAALMPLSQD